MPPVDGADLIEETAQWLYDEGGFGDAYPDRTWPEHEADTGQREGGWVKLVPSDALAKFRDVAWRLLAGRRFAPIMRPEPMPGEVGELVEKYRDALRGVAGEAHTAGVKAGLEAAAKAIIAEHRPTKPEAEWTRRDGTRAHYASKGASVIRALDPKQIAESANCSATQPHSTEDRG